MKLGVGTVQFGLDYGISTQGGQTTREEVQKILQVALKSGARLIDTAASYGNSEEALGGSLHHNHTFDIVTKTSAFSSDFISYGDADQMERTFHHSLKKMKQLSIYGLLIHNADNLLAEGGELLMQKMLELKQLGFVKKIGVSVYTGDQIDRLLKRYTFDLIQIPINVLDQRLLMDGQLSRLKHAGVEVHARSVFLQGLLLMEPNNLPSYFDSVRPHLNRYHSYLSKNCITPLQAALNFVIGLNDIDVAICGVNNHNQLEELVASVRPLPAEMRLMNFAINDPVILNPSNWQKCS